MYTGDTNRYSYFEVIYVFMFFFIMVHSGSTFPVLVLLDSTHSKGTQSKFQLCDDYREGGGECCSERQ